LSKPNIERIIISRTDAIGDVVLTLPMASQIKNHFGDQTEVIFLGKTYTEPIVRACPAIDTFLNYDRFLSLNKKDQVIYLKNTRADAIVHVFPRSDVAVAAKKAGFHYRIGTSHRLFHWTTCNKLVNLGRRNSDLHESQLNIQLLKPLGVRTDLALEEIGGLIKLENTHELPRRFASLLRKDRFKLILHPRAHSSAREWKLQHFQDLIRFLPSERFQIIVTGGEKEAAELVEWTKSFSSDIINLAGLLTLNELLALIASCDGIVAASTGPLHIAAAMGKHALGIYPPIRPMHPGRWAPIGAKAQVLSVKKNCSDCRSNPAGCHCMQDITPAMVEKVLLGWV